MDGISNITALCSIEGDSDDTVSVTLTYSGNRVATFMASKAYPLSNCAEVYGTKGSIQVYIYYNFLKELN